MELSVLNRIRKLEQIRKEIMKAYVSSKDSCAPIEFNIYENSIRECVCLSVYLQVHGFPQIKEPAMTFEIFDDGTVGVANLYDPPSTGMPRPSSYVIWIKKMIEKYEGSFFEELSIGPDEI